jgi:hypothetical protein
MRPPLLAVWPETTRSHFAIETHAQNIAPAIGAFLRKFVA